MIGSVSQVQEPTAKGTKYSFLPSFFISRVDVDPTYYVLVLPSGLSILRNCMSSLSSSYQSINHNFF